MDMDMDIVNIALRIAQILLVPLIAWGVSLWRAQKREIEALKVRVSRNEARLDTDVQVIQTRLSNMPSGATFERLTGEFKALRERLHGMGHFVERVERVLARQEEYLLQNK